MSEGKTAGEIALDQIAALCGIPEWDYPGQVVRDVERLRTERDKLRAMVQALEGALRGADCGTCGAPFGEPLRCQVCLPVWVLLEVLGRESKEASAPTNG